MPSRASRPRIPRTPDAARATISAAIAQLINARTRLVFIANPEQPDRHLERARELEVFLGASRRRSSWSLDEAYFEYSRAWIARTACRWLARYPIWWCCARSRRRMALAGLRVGYAHLACRRLPTC